MKTTQKVLLIILCVGALLGAHAEFNAPYLLHKDASLVISVVEMEKMVEVLKQSQLYPSMQALLGSNAFKEAELKSGVKFTPEGIAQLIDGFDLQILAAPVPGQQPNIVMTVKMKDEAAFKQMLKKTVPQLAAQELKNNLLIQANPTVYLLLKPPFCMVGNSKEKMQDFLTQKTAPAEMMKQFEALRSKAALENHHLVVFTRGKTAQETIPWAGMGQEAVIMARLEKDKIYMRSYGVIPEELRQFKLTTGKDVREEWITFAGAEPVICVADNSVNFGQYYEMAKKYLTGMPVPAPVPLAQEFEKLERNFATTFKVALKQVLESLDNGVLFSVNSLSFQMPFIPAADGAIVLKVKDRETFMRFVTELEKLLNQALAQKPTASPTPGGQAAQATLKKEKVGDVELTYVEFPPTQPFAAFYSPGFAMYKDYFILAFTVDGLKQTMQRHQGKAMNLKKNPLWTKYPELFEKKVDTFSYVHLSALLKNFQGLMMMALAQAPPEQAELINKVFSFLLKFDQLISANYYDLTGQYAKGYITFAPAAP